MTPCFDHSPADRAFQTQKKIRGAFLKEKALSDTDCTRITEKPDYAELFNSAPLWLADQPQKLHDAAFGLLCMTDESAERVRDVLGAYLHGQACTPPEPFTRGLRAVR